MGAGSFLALVGRIRSQHWGAPVHDLADLGAEAHIDDDVQAAAKQQAPAADGLLLLSFHRDLAERLQQLQLQGSGSAHINWLLDALASTLSTHSSLRSALITSTAAAGPATPHLPNQRADEVLTLLDVCSALKQLASDVEHQLGNLQQALESVGQALGHQASADRQKPLSSGRIRAAARRLSACLNDQPHSLLRITSERYRPLAEARASLLLTAKTLELPTTTAPTSQPLGHAMDGTTLTSLLVLASSLASLQPTPPSPRSKSSGAPAATALASKVITKYLGTKSSVRAAAPWAAPLRQLQRDLRQEEMGGGALFRELHSLHAAAAALHASITNPALHQTPPAAVRQSLDCLRKSSREAQACITMLRMHMASLFQALLALRLALLDS